MPPRLTIKLSREQHLDSEILYNGKPLTECSRKELLRLASDAVKFPTINHVEFTKA